MVKLHGLEKVLGSEHPNVAKGLNNLAALYYNQGKYPEAEQALAGPSPS